MCFFKVVRLMTKCIRKSLLNKYNEVYLYNCFYQEAYKKGSEATEYFLEKFILFAIKKQIFFLKNLCVRPRHFYNVLFDLKKNLYAGVSNKTRMIV